MPPLGWTIAHLTAPAVRQWSVGGGAVVRAGPLAVRRWGDGPTAVLLLHGLLSSQAQFGAVYDRLVDGATVVVPDLLGFGASLDEELSDVTLHDHLDALDAALGDLALDDHPTVVAGHSLGSLLAIHWAARHPSRTRAVVGWSPPLYRTAGEAFDRIGGLGPYAAALSRQDSLIGRRLCQWNCNHRGVSGWLSAALAPRLPVPVTRAASRHTWAAFDGALDRVILDPAWEPGLHDLDGHGVPVHLVTGDTDPLMVPGRALRLADELSTVTHRQWIGNHHLPLLQPHAAVAQVHDLVVDGGA